MVRFSCFQANVHCPKPKKSIQPSVDIMHKTLQTSSPNQVLKDLPGKSSVNPSQSEGVSQVNSSLTHVPSLEADWKAGDMESSYINESSSKVTQAGRLIKCRSLGSELYLEGRASADNDAGDETDQGVSSDGSLHRNGLVVPEGSRDRGESPPQPSKTTPASDLGQVSSEIVNNGSIFSIGEPLQSEKDGHENCDTPTSGEFADDSADLTPRTAKGLVKCCSLANISASTPAAEESSLVNPLAVHSRSSEDLHVLGMRQKGNSVHETEMQVKQEQERDDIVSKAENDNIENSIDDGYDSCNYSSFAKDWIVPPADERIEEWVSNLQHSSSPVEETNELSQNDQVKRESNDSNGLTAAKVDGKVTPGMEAAKRYISSLSAAATTAQLANHGLVVIPFLSAFVNLRVLNLSGNSIVRITAGALPRGLHMLNLSKNGISTIEGLRELTRLRVLDMSYNRILRIGHGLASCSSLKELYLAGNKISEVEGLHRLLKLTVLDLRFNKISTAKCLGQLAANYNSLQAISLEGNPAQKNVGDDQLKKYLQGLLPHMVYYNRQQIKSSTLKDAADRSVRLGISNHQVDRSLRPDHKAPRKAGHGVSSKKPSTSSTHGHASQSVASLKKSRGRHSHLPPSGTKVTAQSRQHYFDLGSRIMNLKQDLSMRRSRSEGTMAAM
ncbi:hypothetical protein C1H46_036048 [Malus baccata]|uniref:Uncharacterized protein n=1 Tax=Malus baccata TaxID=106549 RepID=A0A540KW18_MALBA|nr:hypothetical protein C1H46_036048 [Malus baccata]